MSAIASFQTHKSLFSDINPVHPLFCFSSTLFGLCSGSSLTKQNKKGTKLYRNSEGFLKYSDKSSQECSDVFSCLTDDVSYIWLRVCCCYIKTSTELTKSMCLIGWCSVLSQFFFPDPSYFCLVFIFQQPTDPETELISSGAFTSVFCRRSKVNHLRFDQSQPLSSPSCRSHHYSHDY